REPRGKRLCSLGQRGDERGGRGGVPARLLVVDSREDVRLRVAVTRIARQLLVRDESGNPREKEGEAVGAGVGRVERAQERGRRERARRLVDGGAELAALPRVE